MVRNKRKKNSRQRGSHTHGWGSMKKHRGAGNRGGTGKAGSGKRSDSKKPSFWKQRVGKYGFVSRGRSSIRAINISTLEKNVDAYMLKNIAKEEEGVISLNLKDLGYDKLLSKGKVTKKMVIVCNAASSKAVEAVQAAGGKVILPKEAVNNGPEGTAPESS